MGADIQKKNRIIWLDAARTLGIMLVVGCHAVETYYRPVLRGKAEITLLPWIVEHVLFTAGRLGVPLFLAISGALLLKREYQVKDFYKKSLIPLLLTTEIWIVLNYLFVCSPVKNEAFHLPELFQEMLFLKDSSLSHMWYMPVILGIYLVVPFLAKLLRNWEDTSEFRILFVLGFAAFILLPTLKVFGKEAFPALNDLSLEVDTRFWGGCYGLYFVGGYFIAERKVLCNVQEWILWIAAAVAFLFNTAGQRFLYSHGFYKTNGLYWYSDAAIFLMGLILFELLRRHVSGRKVPGERGLTYLSRISFGIYLLHKPIMVAAEKYLPLQGIYLPVKITVLFGISLGGSILLLLPFSFIWKRAGKTVFYIK